MNVVFTTPYKNLNLGHDTLLCSTSFFQINAGTGFSSYLWNTGSIADSIIATSSGDYSVMVQDTANCLYYDTVHVAINPNYFLNIGRDTAYCGNAPKTIDAGSLFNTFHWSTGESTQSITVDTTGVYYVTVTNTSCPQPATDSVKLFFFPYPAADAGRDTLICNGSFIWLNATGGMTYQWAND